AGGGDYFLPVKDNQPELKEAIAAGFDPAVFPRGAGGGAGGGWPGGAGGQRARAGGRTPPAEEAATGGITGEGGGGAAGAGRGVEQVCVIERVRRAGGVEQRETVFAITSLTPQEASAGRLPELARGHWGIENELHWVRDVVLGEDACRVRTGGGPRILSGLR